MQKIFISLISVFLLFTFSVCYADTPKKWTMLIYLNGNNSLDYWGKRNIEDMEKVGSNDQVNVVVQWASLKAKKSVRLLVQKSTESDKVISPILQDLGLVDMGDYHSLQDFIKWGVENFPAEKYFVVVWNHGNGWRSTKMHSNGDTKGDSVNDISYDDISGHWITTEQLGQAMTYAATVMGHKVDLYGSDACMMSMIEVANEMSNSVNYFTGSQETEPGAGWPYTDLLSRWEATPNSTPDQVAKILVDAYVKSYEGGSGGTAEVTFSAVDLNKLPALNQAISNLRQDILALSPEDRLKAQDAMVKAQTFYDYDYADLLDYVKYLSLAQIAINPDDIAKVKSAAQDFIIANEGTKAYSDATGLSIWLPKYKSVYDQYKDRYSMLHFNLDTQWNDALNLLMQGK